MSVTNRSPFSRNWHITCSKDRSAEYHAQQRKKKWHQYLKKVVPTKPKAWFIKPTGRIIHLAICRPTHRMPFLSKKKTLCKVRCNAKVKSAFANKRDFQVPYPLNFLVWHLFNLLGKERKKKKAILPNISSQNFFRMQCNKVRGCCCLQCFKWSISGRKTNGKWYIHRFFYIYTR